MSSVLETLKARKEELEQELKEVDAAITYFGPPHTAGAPASPGPKGWSAETRAKMSARMKELWRQKKVTTPSSTAPAQRWSPEAKARLSARMKELWKKKKLAAAAKAKAGSRR
jgi:hypothetical protein